MFLKQEKPEMNDFEEEKNFGSKGYPCKNATKYFAYSFVLEHYEHFYFMLRKINLHFLAPLNGHVR